MSSMFPEIRFNEGRAAEATTWVCSSPRCTLPYLGEAVQDAVQKGMALGLNVESYSIVLHFSESQSCQDAQRKFQTMLGKGGASQKIIEDVEALDLYHGERWGLVDLAAPLVPSSIDDVLEEDDLSSDGSEVSHEDDRVSETLEEPLDEELGILRYQPDIFSLATPEKRTIRIPGISRALTMETRHEKDLRTEMFLRGGALSEELEKRLFPRGKGHVEQVQEEARALAKRQTRSESAIWWISDPPPYIVVCTKPNMHMRRRVEWILWKAARLQLELTLPVFMALFKQASCYVEDENRLKQFKQAVKLWTGKALDWKDLPSEVRMLVKNINEGKLDCYCKSCRRVLDPKKSGPFCSSSCASLYCSCGVKFSLRVSTDWERLGVLQARLGPYSELLDLACMLECKADVDACRDPGTLCTKFSLLTERRVRERCCTAVEGCMDARWCTRCLSDFQRLNVLGRYVELIHSGKVSWGHCEAAVDRLKKMQEIQVPKLEEKYCSSCEASRKKARTL